MKSRKSSNNTNKLSPQERSPERFRFLLGSNNTNKLSPQEQKPKSIPKPSVQIIQINLVLKNNRKLLHWWKKVQIIQINLVLKNSIRF